MLVGLGAILVVGCAPVEPTSLDKLRRADPGITSLEADDDEDDGSSSTPAPLPVPSVPAANTPEAPAAEPPAPLANDVVWLGRLAKIAPVDFGGAPYCKYTVTFTDLTLKVTMDSEGNVKSTVATARMTETTGASCPHKPIAANTQTFSYMTDQPSAELVVKMAGGTANKPSSELGFSATPGGADKMLAKISLHRTGVTAPIEWTVKSDITLTRQPAPK
jgi:hypothetical protein